MLIQCPNCSYSREVGDQWVPPGDNLVSCPKCAHQFTLHNPGPGAPALAEPLPQESGQWAKPGGPYAQSADQNTNGQSAGGPGIPWEDRSRGLVSAYLATLKMVLFSPQRFFLAMPRDNHYGRPILFALISCAIGLLVYGLVLAAFTMGLSLVYALVIVAASIVIMVPYLFISAAIWHVFLKIFDAGNNGYKTTFRVSCYACAPYIWYVVPFLGGLMCSIWGLICAIIGIKYAQETTYKRVIAAIALYIVFVIVCLVIIVYLTSLFGGLSEQMRLYQEY